VKKVKRWISWFFRPSDRIVYPTDHDRIKKLKKRVKDLEYRVEDIDNEIMIIMREHRTIINALEARIDILRDECDSKCVK
jgi:archaellum component FlaC|tara:strand:- start:299 stop:538 length:240 start_codon:yes stop_codon:yes gene_type:complete